MKFKIIVFLCVLHIASGYQPLPKGSNLVFSTILYRHGERTPREPPYPKDPYGNLSYWPVGWGMLTNRGKVEHYELGKWLRQRYLSLIPEGKYSHDLIYVRSTDYDRTIQSALADLAGMFYPTKEEIWSDLLWQPVPVHVVPEHLDKVLKVGYPCPKYEEDLKALNKSSSLKSYNKQHKKLYDYLTVHSGKVISSPEDVEHIYSGLNIEKENNYTLPEWTRSVFPSKMEPVASRSFLLRTMTTSMKRLRGGPLLKEIISHMKAKREGKLSQNLWVYSAHDTTVGNLLNTMGVFDVIAPPFTATVLVELTTDSTREYFVSVYYKNSTRDPTLLTIPHCTAACPLGQFEKLLSGVIPEDWDRECSVSSSSISNNFFSSIAIVCLVTAGLLFFTL